MKINFAITHNISHSKGWGRYSARTSAGPLVQSSTGNEWVSADHSGEAPEGEPITVVLETMERVGQGPRRRESRNRYEYHLLASQCDGVIVGHWNGMEVTVTGARLAE